MAIKFEGGGKALVAQPLVDELFFAASLMEVRKLIALSHWYSKNIFCKVPFHREIHSYFFFIKNK